MSFIWPVMLISLLLVPLFGWLYLRMQQRRRRIAASYGAFGLMQEATGHLGLRRHIPPALFLAGLVILLTAMARPQTLISLPRVEGTVFLVFDVSGSMAADDLKPTRMEAAKAAAREFVQHQPSTVRFGVVAFSDGGLVVQVPTNDQEATLATINRLSPQRGTSLGGGILAALNTLASEDAEAESSYLSDRSLSAIPTPTPMPEGMYTSAVIVLLSDGENNEDPDPLTAAQAAADRGVRVYTIGIGSTAGTRLHVNGFTVHTQLDETTLQQIAQLTDGVYYNAENEQDLRAVYENLSPELVIKPEKMEVTSVFAGLGILVLLTGGTFSLLWFSRLP